MLSWSLFKHYLLSRRAGALIRTIAWMCIFGIGVGVAALVLVTSVMNGFNKSIRDRMFGIEPHVVYQWSPGSVDFSVLDQLKARWLQGSPEVIEQVQILEKQDVIVRTIEGLFGGAVAKGYEPKALRNLLMRIQRTYPNSRGISSSFVSEVTADLEANEIIMGIDLARSLEVYEGDEVMLIPPEALLMPEGEAPPYQKVRIVSIIMTRLADVDSKSIFYNRTKGFDFLQTAASLKPTLEVRLTDPYLSPALKKKYPAKAADVQTWQERSAALFYALRLEKMSMTIFLSLAALITSFSIVSVLILLLSQKRGDIGILMTMGLSKRQTQVIFTQVGLILSSIGIGSGLLVGLAISLYMQLYPPHVLPDIYYDPTIPAKVDPVTIILIALVGGLIAGLGSYFPVRQGLRATPSEALRN